MCLSKLSRSDIIRIAKYFGHENDFKKLCGLLLRTKKHHALCSDKAFWLELFGEFFAPESVLAKFDWATKIFAMTDTKNISKYTPYFEIIGLEVRGRSVDAHEIRKTFFGLCSGKYVLRVFQEYVKINRTFIDTNVDCHLAHAYMTPEKIEEERWIEHFQPFRFFPRLQKPFSRYPELDYWDDKKVVFHRLWGTPFLTSFKSNGAKVVIEPFVSINSDAETRKRGWIVYFNLSGYDNI